MCCHVSCCKISLLKYEQALCPNTERASVKLQKATNLKKLGVKTQCWLASLSLNLFQTLAQYQFKSVLSLIHRPWLSWTAFNLEHGVKRGPSFEEPRGQTTFPMAAENVISKVLCLPARESISQSFPLSYVVRLLNSHQWKVMGQLGYHLL